MPNGEIVNVVSSLLTTSYQINPEGAWILRGKFVLLLPQEYLGTAIAIGLHDTNMFS